MKRAWLISVAALAMTAGAARALPTLEQSIPSTCATPTAASRSGTAYSATPTNLKSVLASVRGGDTIYLTSGTYGPIYLQSKNLDFVSVMPAAGATPVLHSLSVSGSHWFVTGLTVTGLAPAQVVPVGGWQTHPNLVTMSGGDNIIFAYNTIASQLNAFPWHAETLGVPDTYALSSGLTANNATCVTIYGNTVKNVFAGIGVGGDLVGTNGTKISVVGNKIFEFAADGVDHYGSKILIQNNIIWNSHDICANLCVHTDGVQGWNWALQTNLVNDDITIDGNIITLTRDKSVVLGAVDLHGITMFNGFWTNVKITNNVIINPHWHGIFTSGVNGILIANNTIVSIPGSGVWSWISAGNTSIEGGVSNNTIVRNNISPLLNNNQAANPNQTLVADHNLQTRTWTAAAIQGLFTTLDATNLVYDLHLMPGTSAVGTGSSDSAPLVDLDQTPRTAPVDLGAYDFGG